MGEKGIVALTTSSGQSFKVEDPSAVFTTPKGEGAVHTIKIDKLAMVFDCPGANPVNIANHLQKLKEKTKHGKVTSARGLSKQYHHRFHYRLDTEDVNKAELTVLLCMGAKKSANAIRQFRLEFNPAKFGRFNAALLFVELREIFGEDFEFPRLAAEGTVTSIDLAVDIENISLRDVLFMKEDEHKSHIYFGKTGRAETIYSGIHASSKNGNIKLYNKAQQKVDKASKKSASVSNLVGTQGIPLQRLEIRVSPRLPLVRLNEMKNPFEKLSLYYVGPREGEQRPQHWDWFVDCCRMGGLDRALKNLPEEEAKVYRTALEHQPEQFYRPDAIWSAWWPKTLVRHGLWCSEMGPIE